MGLSRFLGTALSETHFLGNASSVIGHMLILARTVLGFVYLFSWIGCSGSHLVEHRLHASISCAHLHQCGSVCSFIAVLLVQLNEVLYCIVKCSAS